METSYQTILKQTLKERTQANAGYSLRSFARDLGLAPSTLSEILNGRKGLSPKKSRLVAQALRLPDWQASLFCDLVTQDHSKSPKDRAAAHQRLKESAHDNHVRIIKFTALKALTSWIDLGILELTHIKDFKGTHSWITKKLGVQDSEIKESVARLMQAGLLEIENGRWTDVSPLFSTTDGIPNESIRNFQRGVLNLALKKLENTDVTARTVKSVVFSLVDSEIPAAQKILDEAISKIVRLSDKSPQPRDQVMCFSAQLFPLTNVKPGDQS